VAKFLNLIKNNKFLIFILLIALFFRTFDLVGRFEFAHDGDLYSWIVKDIVVDHHPRLIGQLTSAEGIYIGPAFYYLLIPFFLLTGMDPIGAIIPITIIGILTVFSYYRVFSKLFNKSIGLIAGFLYATLLWTVQFDRHVYPSTTTNLWTIWYFFTVVSISRGNYRVLPLLGFLIGLIWHIHIALAPALIAVPVAVLISRRLPNLKEIFLFFLILLTTSVPLLVFEVRHNFSQTVSFINNFTVNHGGGNGLLKLNLILIKLSGEIQNLFFYPQALPLNPLILLVLILLGGLFIVRKRVITFKELTPLYCWIFGIIIFYSLSSTIVSEYYLSNVEIIFISLISILFYLLYKSSRAGQVLVITLMSLILVKNVYYTVTDKPYHKGYVERKNAAAFIKKDSLEKGFPCVAVSYITSPGENVGFRYFFYLNNLHVNQPWSGSPVYSIVLPDELASGKIEHFFGHIKVISPEEIPSKEKVKFSCSGQNSNLTDPMFGFTQ